MDWFTRLIRRLEAENKKAWKELKEDWSSLWTIPLQVVENTTRTRKVVKMTTGGRKPKLSTRQWQRLRYQALKKYGKVCLACGVKPKEVHVDHIKPLSKYPELAFEISNLQVLCPDCNQGKGNWDETDWR